MHRYLPETINPIHWCHMEHLRVYEGSKCPHGLWFPTSLKASHPPLSSNTTALVPGFAWGSVCTRKLGCSVRTRHLRTSPARQTLSLNAFYADFAILVGKMGRSPLAALPRGTDMQKHIMLFPFFATPRRPSPCLFSQTAARQIPGRSLQGLLSHTEAEHHPAAAGQCLEAGAESGCSLQQLMAESCLLQGNPPDSS